ncbi:MAG: metallophosphoesterase [Bdellovibrionaceae bacterium]|nr:metallophosphoesterase [Bdellovibrionales bacterium]MCB9253694.1 metallophosphoesterase [Pseudobdellovibrionaceae bacterium]
MDTMTSNPSEPTSSLSTEHAVTTPLPTRRMLWATKRAALEALSAKSQPAGSSFRRRWELFEQLTILAGVFLRVFGLFGRGKRNAQDVKLKEVTLEFPDLPEAFDGYRILHLTDLHLDFTPGIEHSIASAIKKIHGKVDLAIFTGDFREKVYNGHRQILAPLKVILDEIHTNDGCYATLGNHDTVNMVPDFQNMGIRILANETVEVERQKQKIAFTGVDDVHYYYTEYALEALETSPSLFKVAFVHSAEMYAMAEANNYRLYLAGHTHGGQICLPGGYPVFTHHTAGRARARGLWRHKEMYGYTSCGAGTIALPVRYFSESEVTVFTLKTKRP